MADSEQRVIRLQAEESTMRMLLRLSLLGLALMAFGQVRALAQPAPAVDKVKVAKQYVDAGLAAQSTGDYDTAITLYSKAYQLVPHPLLIFNMAQAHRLAGHVEQALALYARYLAEDPHGAQAQTARELVAELETRKAKQVRSTEDARKADTGRKATSKATGTDAESDSTAGGVRGVATLRNADTDDTPTSGKLVVRAKSQRSVAISDGTVMVDEEPKGKLASGTLTVKDIAEGRHTVAIEAGGYERFEQTVTVHGGEQANLDALLREKRAPSSSPARTVWKVSLGASSVVAVAGGAYALYSFRRMANWIKPITIQSDGSRQNGVSSDDCGKSYSQVLQDENVTAFNSGALDRACTWHTRIYIGFALAGVGAIGAVASLILLSRDPEPPETRGRRAKPAVAIAPIVTPDGGGASFSLTW